MSTHLLISITKEVNNIAGSLRYHSHILQIDRKETTIDRNEIITDTLLN